MLHFVAGPPPMVDAAMRALVLGLKIPPTEIRYDRFG
jgi:toluene monooxygenase electron transfer component